MGDATFDWFWDAPGLVPIDPVNIVAPAIAEAVVIGTEIAGDDGTWTPTPDSYTYQWQRYTGGAWANITDATNKNYTPVDADFGYALRLVVTATPGGHTATSNATDLTVEAPAQSYSAEKMTDGDMEAATTAAYTAHNNATLSKQTGTPHGGSRCLRVAYNGTANPGGEQNGLMQAGKIYRAINYARSDGAAVPRVLAYVGGGLVAIFTGTTSTSWQPVDVMFVEGSTPTFRMQAIIAGAGYAEFDDASLTEVLVNTQLVAPSADMRLDQFYTLPGTPKAGTQLWLYPRISDYATGNYWKVELVYTGSQWDITLYSVAAFGKTSRISAANVGGTNGVRVNMNGTSISLYTTADGGSNWTQRGSTITNSTYQTATGVNAVWTADVTPGHLVYAPAD